MTTQRRHVAFVAVLVAFGVGVALIAALLADNPPVTSETTRTVGARAKAVRGVHARPPRAVGRILPSVRSEDLGARGMLRPRARSARGAAVATFRQFAAAYLRYEAGEVDGMVRRALRATATGSLALQLLRAPARIPPTLEPPPDARLAGRVAATPLGAGWPSGPVKRFAVEAVARGSGSVERLAFVVARGQKGWRVTGPAGG